MSQQPAVSGDGRFVAFSSDASNLVDGDTNAAADVFVRDAAAGTTTRVSVGDAGAQGDGGSYDPAVSGDGRFVVFSSDASNLVAGDTNNARMCSCGTGGGDDDPGERRQRRGAGRRRQLRPCGLGGRSLRRVLLGGVEPRGGGHERRRGCVRAGRGGGHDDEGERRQRRDAGKRRQLEARGVGGRSVRGVLVVGIESRRRRHERPGGRVRPRPSEPHDDAGERRRRGNPGNRRQRESSLSADGRFVAF